MWVVPACPCRGRGPWGGLAGRCGAAGRDGPQVRPGRGNIGGTHAVASWVLAGVGQLKGTPERHHRGGLTRRGRAGDDQTAAGSGLLAAVDEQQAAHCGEHAVHGRGAHDGEFGVVVLAPRLGPGGAVGVTRGRRGSVDEGAPAPPYGRRGQRGEPDGIGGDRAHHRRDSGVVDRDLATPRCRHVGFLRRAGWGGAQWCVFSRPDTHGAVVGRGLLVLLAVVIEDVLPEFSACFRTPSQLS
ncbi:hypothetical protein QFZ43_008790 [Streptomyces afghaniensis]|nr:hypothetical protein [Streptomyces afghaniensis]